MLTTVQGPPVPAPLIRGVDDLTDDEVLAAIEDVQGALVSHLSPDLAAAQARDIFDALAARLRVDGATHGAAR